jgi:hypothetical protein
MYEPDAVTAKSIFMPYRRRWGDDIILVISLFSRLRHGRASARGGKYSLGFIGKMTIRKTQPNQCIKCKGPTAVFQRGKRKGKNSIYCLNHLLQQRETNRLGSNFKRWIETGGDPAAWNAVKEWLSKNLYCRPNI